MSKYLITKYSSLAILLLSSSLAIFPSCKAQNAVNIVSNAALCFNNMTVYRNCQQQFRLTPNGTVLLNMTSSNFSSIFCSGPCMTETQLLLRCVNTMFSNFQFFNGASIQMMGLALTMMCGNGGNSSTAPAPQPQPEQADMVASEVNNTSYSCHPHTHLRTINLLLFLISTCYQLFGSVIN